MMIYKLMRHIQLLILGMLLGMFGSLTHVDAQPGQFFSTDWHPVEDVIAVSDGYHLSIYTADFLLIDHVELIDRAATVYGHQIQWSPDGEKIAVSLSASTDVLNTDTGRVLQMWTWTSNDLQLAYDVPDIHTAQGVVWNPDGTRFVAVPLLTEPNIHITIFDASNGQPITDVGQSLASYPVQLAWSPDGSQIAFDSQGLQIWDANSQQYLGTVPTRFDSTTELAYSPTENLVALVNLDNYNNIEIWNTVTFGLVQTLQGHTDDVWTFSWGAGGIASVGLDGATRIWDPATGQQTAVFQTGVTGTPSWNPQGTAFVAVAESGEVAKTRDAATGQVIASLNLLAPIANAGSDQTVTDTDGNGTEVITLDGSASSDSDGTIASYEWCENGNVIATGATPQVTLSVGVHTITLTVTDNDGLVATDEVVITVEEGTALSQRR